MPIVIVFLIWSEDRSQNCRDKICINTTPSAQVDDHPHDIIDKSAETLRRNQITVDWRRSMLIAMVVAIVTVPFILKKWPTSRQMVIATMVIFIVAYISCVWMQERWWVAHGNHIEKHLLQYRKKHSSKNLARSYQSTK